VAAAAWRHGGDVLRLRPQRRSTMAMEHGHAVRAWSAASAADLRGGAEAAVAWFGSAAWRRSRSCGG
jgi:hypothetical protein